MKLKSVLLLLSIALLICLGLSLKAFPSQGKGLPPHGSDYQTQISADLTQIENYHKPTRTGSWDAAHQKTQVWCEWSDQDDLTFKDRLRCGLTQEPFQRSWEMQTQVWLEQCRWNRGPLDTACPHFPLKTPNSEKYTVTPEPLS